MKEPISNYVNNVPIDQLNDTTITSSNIKVNSDQELKDFIEAIKTESNPERKAAWIAWVIRTDYSPANLGKLINSLSVEDIQKRKSWVDELRILIPAAQQTGVLNGIKLIVSQHSEFTRADQTEIENERWMAFIISVLTSGLTHEETILELLNLAKNRFSPNTPEITALKVTTTHTIKSYDVSHSLLGLQERLKKIQEKSSPALNFAERLLMINAMFDLRNGVANTLVLKAMMPRKVQDDYKNELNDAGYNCNKDIIELYQKLLGSKSPFTSGDWKELSSSARHDVFYSLLIEAGLQFDKPKKSMLDPRVNTTVIENAIKKLKANAHDKKVLNQVIEILETQQGNQLFLVGRTNSTTGVKNAIALVLGKAKEQKLELEHLATLTLNDSSQISTVLTHRKSAGLVAEPERKSEQNITIVELPTI